MEYEIKQVEKRIIAGFHMVGPWEQTVKQGFEQLMMWVDGKQIVTAGMDSRLLRTILTLFRRKNCVVILWCLCLKVLRSQKTAKG